MCTLFVEGPASRRSKLSGTASLASGEAALALPFKLGRFDGLAVIARRGLEEISDGPASVAKGFISPAGPVRVGSALKSKFEGEREPEAALERAAAQIDHRQGTPRQIDPTAARRTWAERIHMTAPLVMRELNCSPCWGELLVWLQSCRP